MDAGRDITARPRPARPAGRRRARDPQFRAARPGQSPTTSSRSLTFFREAVLKTGHPSLASACSGRARSSREATHKIHHARPTAAGTMMTFTDDELKAFVCLHPGGGRQGSDPRSTLENLPRPGGRCPPIDGADSRELSVRPPSLQGTACGPLRLRREDWAPARSPPSLTAPIPADPSRREGALVFGGGRDWSTARPRPRRQRGRGGQRRTIGARSCPRQRDHEWPAHFDHGAYRERNRGERLINRSRLKQFRLRVKIAMATWYEKRAANYLTMLTLAAILLWV